MVLGLRWVPLSGEPRENKQRSELFSELQREEGAVQALVRGVVAMLVRGETG